MPYCNYVPVHTTFLHFTSTRVNMLKCDLILSYCALVACSALLNCSATGRCNDTIGTRRILVRFKTDGVNCVSVRRFPRPNRTLATRAWRPGPIQAHFPQCFADQWVGNPQRRGNNIENNCTGTSCNLLFQRRWTC